MEPPKRAADRGQPRRKARFLLGEIVSLPYVFANQLRQTLVREIAILDQEGIVQNHASLFTEWQHRDGKQRRVASNESIPFL